MAAIGGILVNVKAVRIVGTAGIGVLLGVALARGIPHRAAPAPPPAASSGSKAGFDILALIVTGVVALVIVWAYYRHKSRVLRAETANVDGWERVLGHRLRELWQCPACGSLMRLDLVDLHQNRSACSAYEAWLTEHEGSTEHPEIRADPPPWTAQVRESATLIPDHSATDGGYDSLNPGRETAGAIEE